MNRAMLTQYVVSLPNEPRSFARLARVLAEEKIGRDALVSATAGRKASVQFLARRDPGLRRRLEKAGAVQENQVFQVEMPRHPWELDRLARALAGGEIRIISLFCRSMGSTVRVVLAVDQPANAVDLITRLGFSADYAVQ